MIRERQYKRRFAKWGLDTKNIRDHDMRLALAKDLKRKRKGKDTEFEINGRLLPRQKMQRFMARKELSEEDVIRSDARKSISTSSRVPLLNMKATPPYVTYHTPRPVENDDVVTTLASISLSKDEVMADSCATHDERPENLFAQSKSIWADKQHEERASTSLSMLSCSDEVSEDISKILERNEAWLEKRCKARNDPELILAYAKLMWICKKIQRSTTLHKHLPMWKSYFQRRLDTDHSDSCGNFLRTAWPYYRLALLDFIKGDFETLGFTVLYYWGFEELESDISLNPAIELVPSITIGETILSPMGSPTAPSGTKQDFDHDELLRKAQSNSSVSHSESVLSNLREGPFRELQPIPTASPFERWSQRYDISSSPNWIRSYMSPSNPLTLLTPAPIGTPWDHIPKASPRPTGSQWYGCRVYNFDDFLVNGKN
jgi:hypothetical protein